MTITLRTPPPILTIFIFSIELEFIAQCWANSCSAEPDDCKTTPAFGTVGQNIYFASDPTEVHTNLGLEVATKFWFNEIDNLNEALIANYSRRDNTNAISQMLWADTRFVGCGRTRTRSGAYIICNYGPAGNVEGQPIYSKGVPCEVCPMNCNPKYLGLCELDEAEDDYAWDPPFFYGGVAKTRLMKGIWVFTNLLIIFML